MEIKVSEAEGVYLIRPQGRLVLGEPTDALRDVLNRLLSEGRTRFVLNLERINFIDSASIGALVAAHHSVKSRGGSLKLSNLGRRFQDVLQMTRLVTVFDVFTSEAEAVRSFAWCYCEHHGHYPGPPPCPKCH